MALLVGVTVANAVRASQGEGFAGHVPSRSLVTVGFNSPVEGLMLVGKVWVRKLESKRVRGCDSAGRKPECLQSLLKV